MSAADDTIGEELARWGKVAWLETTGRSTGNPVTAAVGFVEAGDGVLFVAAGSESADWALNLRVNPRCQVMISDLAGWYDAVEADDPNRAKAVVDLILKYGTPAERLGRGPVFRLTPVA